MKKTLAIIFIPFLTLCIVQLFLNYPETRKLFTQIEVYESGAAAAGSASGAAYVELTLVEGGASDDILVYFNANEIARFNSSSLTLALNCDGVIQIKNGTDEDVAVAVSCNPPHCIDIINTTFSKGLSALCTFSLG